MGCSHPSEQSTDEYGGLVPVFMGEGPGSLGRSAFLPARVTWIDRLLSVWKLPVHGPRLDGAKWNSRGCLKAAF